MIIKTGIIPEKQHFVGVQDQLDFKAICIFAATGFFLDDDTYFVGQKVLQPATVYEYCDDEKIILSQKKYFEWHYKPVDRSLAKVVEEFASLFEKIVADQTKHQKVILP
ncbi:MAG: asparagine synthetase B family protein, partial [Flavobacterium sp.]